MVFQLIQHLNTVGSISILPTKYLMYKVQMTNDAHKPMPSASNAIKTLSTDNSEITYQI